MSDLHERAIAEDCDGRPTPNSGAGTLKADVHNAYFMIEGKSSFKPSFRLSFALFNVLQDRARSSSKIAAISCAHLAGDPGVVRSLRILDMVYVVETDMLIRTLSSLDLRRVKSAKRRLHLGDATAGRGYRSIIDNRGSQWLLLDREHFRLLNLAKTKRATMSVTRWYRRSMM